MASRSKFPTLLHQPLGEQHPYQPLPYERRPRAPSAGEPVELGIETGKNPSADTVWCVWRKDVSSVENRVDARLCSRGESADQWQVSLPAFNSYDVIYYRLFAESEGHQSESEEFSFFVLGWEEATGVVEYEATSKTIAVKLATSRKSLFIHLQVELSPDGTLSLQLDACEENNIPNISQAKGSFSARLGDIRMNVQTDPLLFEINRESDGLKLQGACPLRVLVSQDGTVVKYRLEFLSPANEAFYGFGERFNALDQRGNQLDNYVFGQYTNQGVRTYIPIPFFLSSRGYGLWVQTERQAFFDLAHSKEDRWSLTGCGEEEHARLELKLFLQSGPREIIQGFTRLIGKPQLPPAWVFGLWMSSNDWNSQAEVLRQLHKTQELEIPATVLVIEAWSDETNFYIWNDAEYDQKPSSLSYGLDDFHFPPGGLWPDPKSMVNELHQAGVRLVLWQIPVIKYIDEQGHLAKRVNESDQEHAIQQGYVVLRDDGKPHHVEAHMPWFAGSLVLDFTNPAAAAWWVEKRKYLIKELGVDGFKTDGGEHIWDNATRFHNGMRGDRGINDYPLAYEAAFQRLMQECRGDDHVLFSRAGYTGVQKYSCHWAGDERSTWEAFRATICAMLNVSICGVSFIGWDIAGFSGPIPSSELYLRAAAFSVFCPIMQYHSEGNDRRIPSRDRTPWNIQEQTGDQQVIPVFRKFANLRMNLLPYILSQARQSSQSGLPLMRALQIEYPTDMVCRKYPFEYMFGDALLVAPVVEEGISAWPVYLPQGEWRDLWSGTVYQGPAEIIVDVPRDRIPVFQKKGSLIPLHLDQSGELGSPVGNSTSENSQLSWLSFPD